MASSRIGVIGRCVKRSMITDVRDSNRGIGPAPRLKMVASTVRGISQKSVPVNLLTNRNKVSGTCVHFVVSITGEIFLQQWRKCVDNLRIADRSQEPISITLDVMIVVVVKVL